MPAADDNSAAGRTAHCPHCAQEMRVRPEWFGQQVQCPHCGAPVPVPADGPAASAAATSPAAGPRFTFPCPRCKSLLESSAEMEGQPARCPTCNAPFEVPSCDPQTGRPLEARLLDADRQDPTPMHAYAASGHQAPRISHRADGTSCIECPRCGAQAEVTADNCPACGVPFTLDGVSTPSGKPGRGAALTSLVLGLVAIPGIACMLGPVCGPAAVVFGLASWFRRGTTAPPGQALAGIILGLAATAFALLAL